METLSGILPIINEVNDLELLKNIKGHSSVSEAFNQLQLQSLQNRRISHRLSLLMGVLSGDTKHQARASPYEELKDSKQPITVSTRAARKGEPASIFESSEAYLTASSLIV